MNEQELHDLHGYGFAVAGQLELDPTAAAGQLQLPATFAMFDPVTQNDPGPGEAHVRGVVIGGDERALGQRFAGKLGQGEVGVCPKFQFTVGGGAHGFQSTFDGICCDPPLSP